MTAEGKLPDGQLEPKHSLQLRLWHQNQSYYGPIGQRLSYLEWAQCPLFSAWGTIALKEHCHEFPVISNFWREIPAGINVLDMATIPINYQPITGLHSSHLCTGQREDESQHCWLQKYSFEKAATTGQVVKGMEGGRREGQQKTREGGARPRKGSWIWRLL